MTIHRWQQRLDNYTRAHAQLAAGVALAKSRVLSDLEKQGLVQGFEYTFELAWKVLKDYLSYQGNPDITGSRDAIREAFSLGLINEGEVWMEMISSRNKSSHTYNESIVEEIIAKIIDEYSPLFAALLQKMTQLSERNG